MDTKLTLTIDKDIIEQTTRYAQSKQQSLSVLVERYFRYLLDQEQSRTSMTISPTVKELSGVIHLDNDHNLREEYADYLLEKYLA